jgi:hypothetical protein
MLKSPIVESGPQTASQNAGAALPIEITHPVNLGKTTANSSSKCTQGDFPFLKEDFIACSVSEAFLGPVV